MGNFFHLEDATQFLSQVINEGMKYYEYRILHHYWEKGHNHTIQEEGMTESN